MRLTFHTHIEPSPATTSPTPTLPPMPTMPTATPTRTPTQTPTCTPGTYDDNQATYYGTWYTRFAGGAYGGSFHENAQKSYRPPWARFSFVDNSITWITAQGPAYGEAGVWISDQLVDTVNNYAPQTQYQVHHTYAMSPGSHTILIRPYVQRGVSGARGRRGPPGRRGATTRW